MIDPRLVLYNRVPVFDPAAPSDPDEFLSFGTIKQIGLVTNTTK